jgi:outer membrane lipoprotein-sorting protein
MKKTILILMLLAMPISVMAQSMVETNGANVDQESNTVVSNSNTESQSEDGEDEKKTITININLPNIKLLPSSPFYFLKKWWEGIKGWFAFGIT